ncbi:MAG: 1-acyl-sn-glycerol-3-phosphate acyltransferase [Xanthomonadaceae bacterium]|nr:1-acyl-sn-glycerol-3-phosphate acyltransferase [Xanthomonadaceae bacterium]
MAIDSAPLAFDPLSVHMPACTPRTHSRFGRWFGRTLLRLGGWRMVGAWPDCRKVVIIVAPHSSGWDGIWGLGAKVGLGLGAEFMGKAELFWGPLGWLLRKMGGIATRRQDPRGMVEAIAARFAERDTMWLAIAPEGTRRPGVRWKTGFWRIARAANVPVQCVAFDYPSKAIVVGPLLHLSDDMNADLDRIAEVYAPYQGKKRGVNPVR